MSRSEHRSCETCQFFYADTEDYYCRRHAPRPHSFIDYYHLELIRDIAWALHELAKLPPVSKHEALATDATEAMIEASWPKVDPDDWCGEWKPNIRSFNEAHDANS